MRRIFARLAVAVLMTAASPAFAKTITETAADTGAFTVLMAAIKQAGMTEMLSGPGPYTLFAPSDDAFGKLPKATYQGLFLPENKGKLRELLSHHLVAGTIMGRDVSGKRMEADPMYGESLLIDGTRVMLVNGARVTQPDMKADNGIIHVIDTVLMPAK